MKDVSHSLLRMLEILSTQPKTIKELSQILELSPRQISRNIMRLEDRGYCVDKNMQNRYFIFGAENIRNRVFNEEEQELISKMLAIYAPFHPVYSAIKLKLKSATMDIPFAYQTKDLLKSKNYEVINYALKNRLRIKLRNYVSPFNPDMPEERLLEPLEFVEQHCQLIAYEVASRKEKVFKIDRMGKVELTNEATAGRAVKNTLIDPFGFSSTKQKIVKLRLSLLAKVLLEEDFPTAKPYLILKGEVWYFHGPYCSFLGIGRFILGLPGEVTVVYGPELKVFLTEQKKNFTF
ncbi:YafY family protein [Lacihabitans sp. CCS-44]|uniref:helix-turn-helix transcriptional regulator n=1 Tax=Lacihabitans sp. CCS-44 TaxID=2487331 RepID=UPI0020CD8FD5|nr:WYL domain-containing protein [Lacihabitans sp. CCS-44]